MIVQIQAILLDVEVSHLDTVCSESTSTSSGMVRAGWGRVTVGNDWQVRSGMVAFQTFNSMV